MSRALQRFAELQRAFRSLIPARKLSAEQRHHLLQAASITQVTEEATARATLGISTCDQELLERLQAYARRHLARAGVRHPEVPQ